MSQKFISSNRLATLAELQYLLLEVLDRKEPIANDELYRLCKERSLNLAFALENTLAFLQAMEIIIINDNLSVTRNEKEDFEPLKTEAELTKFITEKTVIYLKNNKLFEKIISNETLIVAGDVYTIHTDKIASGFAFIKVLLLNFKIAATSKNSNDQLVIFKAYNSFFTPTQDATLIITSPKVPPPLTPQPPKPPAPAKPVNLFISYSHIDERFNDELKNHFAGLKNQGLITGWDGRAILPGEDWDDEVRKKLEQADIILFLVSSDFMASEYIRDVEIHKAIERHNNGEVRIIPVLLRSCDYRSLPIARLQVVPRGAKPINNWEDKDVAYLNVVEQIRNILMQ